MVKRDRLDGLSQSAHRIRRRLSLPGRDLLPQRTAGEDHRGADAGGGHRPGRSRRLRKVGVAQIEAKDDSARSVVFDNSSDVDAWFGAAYKVAAEK